MTISANLASQVPVWCSVLLCLRAALEDVRLSTMGGAASVCSRSPACRPQ